MSNQSISNSYNPIEDLFTSSSSQTETHQVSVETSKDYNPIEALFQTDTNDESLSISLTKMSEDFNNIVSDTHGNPSFFSPDVVALDLFNAKPAPDLRDTHESFVHLEVAPINPQFEVFDSPISNVKLQEIIEDFNQIDLHILTPASLEKLKQIEGEGRVPKELVADNELELDIQKVDIKRNPEQVAWAVQNNAFICLKQLDELSVMIEKVLATSTIKINSEESEIDKTEELGNSGETEKSASPMELKVDTRWVKFIEHNIKKINVYDDGGKLQRELHHGDFQVVEFTAAEVEFVSRLAFAAIQASSILRQRKDEEVSAKKGISEEQRVKVSFMTQNRSREVNGKIDLTALPQKQKLERGSISTEAIEGRIIEKQKEDKREQQELQDQMDKQDRIIKKEISRFDKKHDQITEDNRASDIKKGTNKHKELDKNKLTKDTTKKEINKKKKEKIKVSDDPVIPPIDIVDNTKEKLS